jgi:hypothetical protein
MAWSSVRTGLMGRRLVQFSANFDVCGEASENIFFGDL